MCKQGEWQSVHTKDNTFAVDRCIADLVQALNDIGFPTVACCCGHGKQPTRISLKDGRELFIAPDYETAQGVSAAFPPINEP